MSRRTVTVEEFDDDTDLPLPSRPLPNTGTRGAILEEIDTEYEVTRPPEPLPERPQRQPSQPGPASPSKPQFKSSSGADGAPGREQGNMVTDITPYKSWTCVYPIYIDAKRGYGTGERRIARAKSLWYPLSKDIADATSRLGLSTLHEVNKSHPRDWDNPGRVRVQWKKDGKLCNPHIKTKKQLLEMISFQIQRLKPDNVPREPYSYPSSHPTPPQITSKPNPPSAKGKQPIQKTKAPSPSKQTGSLALPVPPEPQPELASRVSPYSPALATGMLLETIKAGMNAPDGGAGGAPGLPGVPGAGGTGAAGQKGKRKVVRVRG
ncbi:hypothetical protein JAAARDRAFT_32506 [Jaapia argillacea MUCL 33604]|uniref:Signal recognition particle SRP19 subunit n=1 Tax=Jaapia argillacea MUCL 33604 TaxID=933084 RepID=A0A067Q9E9_9AGAM|nr:hypothetical protein JAAARDRAFT_32506 [Jaapia argillacea MUCL 33604]